MYGAPNCLPLPIFTMYLSTICWAATMAKKNSPPSMTMGCAHGLFSVFPVFLILRLFVFGIFLMALKLVNQSVQCKQLLAIQMTNLLNDLFA